ncbi:glycosyltransferase family 2 protein [Proteus mirabilis]|uniref:glycosyltransferase family 2 protein n=1 Tax=Proteus mirabilis TaxID=584 RepID=UPI0018C53812|nr:glycosyltransferase [Proteus mirabilis]HCT9024698.1 glycosyltransferase [Proteus mirabilis]
MKTNTNTPLISVIMPAYNVEEWINESIDSILNQTITNLELIVVDDCSTDNTYNLIKSQAIKDNRIKLFKNEKNSKICKTLNFALKQAKGQYIARIDSDDIAIPDRLEKQLIYLNKKNLDLVGSQMVAIDEHNNKLSCSKLPTGFFINKTKYLASPITHIWLCKKEIYDSLNGYRNIPYAEDYDFVLRALDFGYKCDNHPDALMFIRHRDGNTATTASLAQRKTHNYVLKLARERKISKNLKDSFSEEQLQTYIKSSVIFTKIHNYSSLNLSKAIKEKSKIKKFLYIMISLLTSYYNFQYLFRRIIFRIIKKRTK